jgi:DNA mismatch repair protein MSH3
MKPGSSSAAVPNDLELRGDGVRAAIIMGPNMGGKSCLIRQAALTVIMAQVKLTWRRRVRG